jgi:uncharacterized membrane protein HdeD (DUF308 family)
VRQIARWQRDWRFIRDILSFAIGSTVMIWEMINGFHNPLALGISGALLGVAPISYLFQSPRDDGNGNHSRA